MNEEMLKKAVSAKTAEELMALARENGLEMSAEQAKEMFERLHSLDDDQLDDVAGGVFAGITLAGSFFNTLMNENHVAGVSDLKMRSSDNVTVTTLPSRGSDQLVVTPLPSKDGQNPIQGSGGGIHYV